MMGGMVKKTIEDINEKIKKGEAVILSAEEIIGYAAENGASKTLETVDIVTTATFGAMCSSGAFINLGHSDPPMRLEKVFLNDVEAYGGLAAVDIYIGATQESALHGYDYGGAHVIYDFICGRDIKLEAKSKGTDCYPRTEISTYINKYNVNQAIMFNPRNGYQNYSAATNSSDRMLHTYMGALLPKYGNVNYCTSGELSPLLNDPFYKTIGIGTKVFLGGTWGYVAWQGTQHAPSTERNSSGVPIGGAGTLALIGDLKKMSPKFVKPARYNGYGVSLFIGFGVPIPLLNEEILEGVLIQNKDISTNIFDYSVQSRNRPVVRKATYAELRSGSVNINGVNTPTTPMSSLKNAREVAKELKEMILRKEFYLTEMIESLPLANKGNVLDVRGPSL
jgi:L-aspartate semialdehyde sulfurtransferase